MTEDGRRQRGEQTRQRILQAALEVLGQEGYAGASSRAVAQAAGVSPATLFHHFGSVDALLLDATMHLLNEETDSVETAEHSDPEAYLMALGRLMAALLRDHPVLARASTALQAHVPFDERFRERAHGYLEAYVTRTARHLAALTGREPGERERAVARATVMLADGVSMHAVIRGDTDWIEPYWRWVVPMLTAGLEAHD